MAIRFSATLPAPLFVVVGGAHCALKVKQLLGWGGVPLAVALSCLRRAFFAVAASSQGSAFDAIFIPTTLGLQASLS